MNPTVGLTKLSARQKRDLIDTLRARFEAHRKRHPGVEWASVQARLVAQGQALAALQQMESTGGEPDVVAWDEAKGLCLFVDCSPESPMQRRGLCYDWEGWLARKEHRPRTSALDMAAAMGIQILTEEQYSELQSLGEFDLKSSSWLATPPEIRQRGGALYGERRYDRVFVGHNGAQSYYSTRAFRGALWV